MRTLKESITQSRRICESSILSGRKASIESSKKSVHFDYDKIVNILLTHFKTKHLHFTTYIIHNFEELNRFFDTYLDGVPTQLTNLKLPKRYLIGVEQIMMMAKDDCFEISIYSTDKSKVEENAKIIKSWIGPSYRLEESSSQRDDWTGTVYEYTIEIFKK